MTNFLLGLVIGLIVGVVGLCVVAYIYSKKR